MADWKWRLGSLPRRRHLQQRTREEMEFHLQMETEDGIRSGLSPDEARRRARLRAGSLVQSLEAADDARGIGWLDGLGGDLRHAARALARSRGFGIISVLVLAATVAVNTLIFFMLDGVGLRPLPYASPGRLVRLYDSNPRTPKFPMSIGHYAFYSEQAPVLEGLALYTGRDLELSAPGGAPRRLTGVAITGNYFQLLGASPLRGRSFAPAEQRDGVRNVIISARLWRDDFRADPAVVGRTLRLDREIWTIVGVAPDGFEHVGGDYRSPMQGDTVDVWTPLALDGSEQARRQFHYCNAVARLHDGVSLVQARSDLERAAAIYERQFHDAGPYGIRVEPLQTEVTGQSAGVIWLLVAAGALVLALACANIAGLCIARAVSRRHELALRRALGASAWQIVRVGLAENVLVGVAGAALGLLLAAAGLPLLRQLLPADFPRAHEIGLTFRSGLFATLTALATVVAAGLLASGRRHALETSSRVTSGLAIRRLRTALVVGEIALAGLLCAGALLLLRSYERIGALDHGFRPGGVLTFGIAATNGSKPEDGARLYRNLTEALARVPGVTAAGAATNLPWDGYDENSGFDIVGRAEPRGAESPSTRFQSASPGYFAAVGMRLVAGRLFDPARDRTGQALSVIVNDALASRYFPKGDAVGTTVDVFGSPREIVGVVAAIRDSPADPTAEPALWFPLDQVPFGRVWFAVRSDRAPAALTGDVGAAIAQIDPLLPMADVRTLDARASEALASRRFALWLLQAFAALGLVLAAAGIYGLLAYVVRQRRRELSIRVALGATRIGLCRMVLGDGMRMALLGAVACVVLIPFSGRLLASFLFGVTASDPVTIAVTPLALLAVAALASAGPAAAATRCNPSAALRED